MITFNLYTFGALYLSRGKFALVVSQGGGWAFWPGYEGNFDWGLSPLVVEKKIVAFFNFDRHAPLCPPCLIALTRALARFDLCWPLKISGNIGEK